MADTVTFTDRSDLREKLKAIRDSDHPAWPYARNIVEMMDMRSEGQEIDMAWLGINVAMFQRRLRGRDRLCAVADRRVL